MCVCVGSTRSKLKVDVWIRIYSIISAKEFFSFLLTQNKRTLFPTNAFRILSICIQFLLVYHFMQTSNISSWVHHQKQVLVEKVCLEHSKYDQLTCQFDPELEIKKLVRFHRSIFYNTCSIIFLWSLGGVCWLEKAHQDISIRGQLNWHIAWPHLYLGPSMWSDGR